MSNPKKLFGLLLIFAAFVAASVQTEDVDVTIFVRA